MTCDHDYVNVESMTVIKATEKFAAETGHPENARYYLQATEYGGTKVLYDKACLKCGHCITDLTDYRESMNKTYKKGLKDAKEKHRDKFIREARKAAQARERLFSAREIFRKFVE